MDTNLIKTKYQRNVRIYDFVSQAFALVRSRAIPQLGLRGGETVIDFGCGTGLSFGLIERAIGPEGRLIGVELSPAMLVKAREKIASHVWENITLIEANAEEVDLQPESVDAVLSFYTHDIMASRRAVENAVQALRPGGHFVIAGSRFTGEPHKWLLYRFTLSYAQTAITRPLTIRPWATLEDVLGSLKVQEHLWGSSYIACGTKTP